MMLQVVLWATCGADVCLEQVLIWHSKEPLGRGPKKRPLDLLGQLAILIQLATSSRGGDDRFEVWHHGVWGFPGLVLGVFRVGLETGPVMDGSAGWGVSWSSSRNI